MKSLTEEIYNRQYNDIMAMKLKPGQRLHIADLCKKYEAGLSPVREALAQLTATDFVVAIPQKGFRVAEVSLDDLHDLYQTRSCIEELALRLAIEHGNDVWEADCLAAYHRLATFEKNNALTTWEDYQEWEERHRANHRQGADCLVNLLLALTNHSFLRIRRIDCRKYMLFDFVAHTFFKNKI